MASRWRSLARWLAGAVVVTVVSALTGLTALQRWPADVAWLELARYLPYYWLCVLAALAFALSAWLGRWWLLASVAAIALMATLWMGLEWHAGERGSERIRLMTFNVKGAAALNRPEGVSALAAEVLRQAPDILVMQDADGLLVARDAAPLTGGPAVFGLPNVYALGQYVVASRLPLQGCAPAQIGYRDQTHRYLRCTFDVHGTALTVVTAHFRSPREGLNATRQGGVAGADEWAQNFGDRLAQARTLASAVALLPKPLIVAGDLNAPESSPVIQALLDAGLRNAFSAAGRGYGYTYGQSMRWGWSFLRIDHILVSPEIGVERCVVGGGAASEHRPVIADVFVRR